MLWEDGCDSEALDNLSANDPVGSPQMCKNRVEPHRAAIATWLTSHLSGQNNKS